MPRREILSPAQREELLVVPVDRAGLIEHYVLSEQDISLIRQRRGDRNRLGIAATCVTPLSWNMFSEWRYRHCSLRARSRLSS